MVENNEQRLNASEALFGFCGWLTSRKEKTIMSARDNAAPIANLITTFVHENNLPDIREGWNKALRHPKELMNA